MTNSAIFDIMKVETSTLNVNFNNRRNIRRYHSPRSRQRRRFEFDEALASVDRLDACDRKVADPARHEPLCNNEHLLPALSNTWVIALGQQLIYKKNDGWKSPYLGARANGQADDDDERAAAVGGGDLGDDDLALVHIANEDDDDRARDGEESEVGGCDCDGAGHAHANEQRAGELELNDESEGFLEDGMTLRELREEEEEQVEVMAANAVAEADTDNVHNAEPDEEDEEDEGAIALAAALATLQLQQSVGT